MQFFRRVRADSSTRSQARRDQKVPQSWLKVRRRSSPILLRTGGEIFLDLNLAHRALAAAEMLLLPAADNLRRLEVVLTFPPTVAGVSARSLAHRARCAAAMRLGAAAETTRPCPPPRRTGAVLLRPINSSSTEITESSFSTCNCACLRSFVS